MTLTQEKKKQILAGLLFVGLLGALYYNFFSGDNDPPTTATRPAATVAKKPSTQAQAPKGATAPAETLVSSALDLASMSDKAQTGGTGRNIFIYPTPTPPPPVIPTPPPPTPPPPPITLVGVSPSGVIARTAGFTLTVMGAKIPADARASINGRPYPTTFVSETQVKVAVDAAAIAAPGPLRIDVKSAQDPAKMYSNAVNLNVSAPPTPPYKYMMMMIKDGVVSAAVKFDLDEETQIVTKGKVLGGHWRIVNITQDGLEILDTNINVSHTIKFSGTGEG